MKTKFVNLLFGLAVLLAAAPAYAFTIDGTAGTLLEATEIAVFDEPWAMTILPDGSMLVTEKPGRLTLLSADGTDLHEVTGIPKVAYGGQGGLGDIVLHPDYANNSIVYLSWIEPGTFGRRGAAVGRGRLVADGEVRLADLEVIWRQKPKTSGWGHYSHRIVFGPTGKLFITSGDRQKMEPAQDTGSALGKTIRLNEDGSIPEDNPFQNDGDLARSFWTVGHRNSLGIAFDAEGRLWAHEMGPRHGDELNIIIRGQNYGWPLVSEGNHYSGKKIPDHDTQPEFAAPAIAWVPSIAPSGLVIYDGAMFAGWRGDALIGGLVSRALIHVELDGEKAREAERFEWDSRIREVEQGHDGALFVLEDGPGGRLLRLTPAR